MEGAAKMGGHTEGDQKDFATTIHESFSHKLNGECISWTPENFEEVSQIHSIIQEKFKDKKSVLEKCTVELVKFFLTIGEVFHETLKMCSSFFESNVHADTAAQFLSKREGKMTLEDFSTFSEETSVGTPHSLDELERSSEERDSLFKEVTVCEQPASVLDMAKATDPLSSWAKYNLFSDNGSMFAFKDSMHCCKELQLNDAVVSHCCQVMNRMAFSKNARVVFMSLLATDAVMG